jgi:signal transduction histidine kinase
MLFNAIDEGFCIIEVIFDENEGPIDYRFLEINPSFEKQTGLIGAQGKRMRELVPEHEEHWFEIYGKIAVTGQPVRFVNRAEQLHRWYDVYAFRIGQPENRQVAVLFNDITGRRRTEDALRKSEELYRSLFDNMMNGYAYCKMYFEQNRPHDFVYISVNRAFESLTGLKNVVGKKASEAVPGMRESDPELFEIYGRVALTGKPEQFEKYVIALQMWFSVSVYSPAKEHFISVFDIITERKQAEQELWASHEQLRALAGRLQAVREEERTQIAREIHDELGGALTGMRIDFSRLTRTALKIEDEAVKKSLLDEMDSLIKFIDATIHIVRRIAMELRPGVLDDLGLVAALEWQLKDFEKRTGIRCDFFPSAENISLDADLSTALFRIFQEALTNVARHSGAREVCVHLSADADSSTLEVEDNGKGIEKEQTLGSKSLGLLGMRERAQMFGGRITVTGTPGRGTIVTVEIPSVEKRKPDRDQEGAAG